MILTVFVVGILNLIVLIFLFFKKQSIDLSFLQSSLKGLSKEQVHLERTIREEMSLYVQKSREDLQRNFSYFTESLFSRLNDSTTASKNQLDIFSKQLNDLTKVNEEKLEKLRRVVDDQLKFLRDDNSVKLDKIRETVDEKLHSTLEKRLGESFNLVSDRLEQVKEGLGEMKTLASGVGDLKKVLTNIKTRGTWGEIQLGNLLEQILTADQFDKNVITKKTTRDSVEFAVRMPGKNDEIVYLPIDAKFPKEDYERLQSAQEKGDMLLVNEANKGIERCIKEEAKKIHDKYIDPPYTTDFAILYLPIEGLFGEVLRRDGLYDFIQRNYRVIIAGPTTISALLNSLQMGFRTLAVEKRASDVWITLSKVKTEFGRFGEVLRKTKDKLGQASKEIEKAEVRSRVIERNLKDVQSLPSVKNSGDVIESIQGDEI